MSTGSGTKRISPARTVTLRPEMDAWAEQQARLQHRSVSFIINQALEELKKKSDRDRRRRNQSLAANIVEVMRDRKAQAFTASADRPADFSLRAGGA